LKVTTDHLTPGWLRRNGAPYSQNAVITEDLGNDRRLVIRQPVYLRVPPVQAKNWSKHCGKYGACGQPVYFVQDGWYNNVYVPHYREYEAHGHGKKGHREIKAAEYGCRDDRYGSHCGSVHRGPDRQCDGRAERKNDGGPELKSGSEEAIGTG
jgi:hypothetical protein